jgi:hypothetical protein
MIPFFAGSFSPKLPVFSGTSWSFAGSKNVSRPDTQFRSRTMANNQKNDRDMDKNKQGSRQQQQEGSSTRAPGSDKNSKNDGGKSGSNQNR